MDKPEVSLIRGLGVEIHALDWQTAGADKLVELFRGADTIISTVFWGAGVILDQKKLVDAAKSAKVKRFIPCDFGTACPPGVMQLHDDVRILFHDNSLFAHYFILEIGDPRIH